MRRALVAVFIASLVWLVTLAGAPSAQAVPSVTYECTPAPADCSGWFRSDVAIDWTVLPSDASVTGCEDKAITAETPGTEVSCSANDGSTTVKVDLTVKVDRTAPVVTGGVPGRQADSNGWYNHAVEVEFAGSDSVSGVDACTTTTYRGPDDGTAALTGTCTDRAGNVSEPLGYGLKYDATGPAVSTEPDSAPNAAGWFNSPVAVAFSGVDATSGVAECQSPPRYAGPDTAAGSLQGRCTDHAGNATDHEFDLKYDATAPVMTSEPDRAPNAAGWFNSPVTVTFEGDDATSGVADCESARYAGPDAAAASISGRCRDRAGNVATRVHSLKYDTTAPVVTSEPDRAPNAAGWFSSPVTVEFSGVDATSGVAGCQSPPMYTGPDTGSGSVSGRCTDNAGNVATRPHPLKYDATAPVVTAAPDHAPNAAGWFNAPVTVAFRGEDATSGVASCESPPAYAGPDTAAHTLTGRCRDHAGNLTPRDFALKYDATAPAVTAKPDRAPNAAGWFNRPVTVGFEGTDATSGVADCQSPPRYAGPDTGAGSVTGRCRDHAGNVTPRDFAFKYDATDPVATEGSPARPPDAGGWYNRAVTVAFAGTDQTSGVEACTAPRYNGPDSGTASVTGACADKAGNVSAPLAHVLKFDATGPEVTADPDRTRNANGWFNAPVTVTFNGVDATSGLAGCQSPPIYGGPDTAAHSLQGRCTDNAGNVTNREFAFKYDATGPAVTALPDRAPNAAGWFNRAVTVTFDGTDLTAGIAGCQSPPTFSGPDTAAGSVSGRCSDRAGNVTTRDFPLKYDATNPEVTEGTATRLPDAGEWYNRAVAIAFTGKDDTSGIASCTTANYGGPDSVEASVTGTCRDKAGNPSGEGTFELKYDETPPEVTEVHAQRPPEPSGWYVEPVQFEFAGTDLTSGLDTCPPLTYTGPDGAGDLVSGTCRDRAGNVTRQAFPIKYDATAPAVTALTATGGDRSVLLSWHASPDTASVEVLRSPGVGAEKDSTVFRGSGTSFVDRKVDNGIRYSYEVHVRDAAGHAGAATVVGIPAAPPPAPAPPQAPAQAPAAPPVVQGVAALVPPPLGIAPARGAVLKAGTRPLLQWPGVRRARYYNVQLYRDGRKILSTWPLRAQYHLKLRWRYGGATVRLVPGRYRWMVWPGYGPRSKADYGKRIVTSTFKLRRGA